MSFNVQNSARASLRKPVATAPGSDPAPAAQRPNDAAGAVAPQIAPDRRLHARFEVNLLGRMMRADKQEYPCRVKNMSIGDAAILCPVATEVGERIVAYVEHIGGIEGTVTRLMDDGFAMKISASNYKREKLAAQITWLINRSELDGADARRGGHERITTAGNTTILKYLDGEECEVQLADVSISGASVRTAVKPPLGSDVLIGKLRALVVRHHPEGIGVQFLDIQNPDALRRYFG